MDERWSITYEQGGMFFREYYYTLKDFTRAQAKTENDPDKELIEMDYIKWE